MCERESVCERQRAWGRSRRQRGGSAAERRREGRLSPRAQAATDKRTRPHAELGASGGRQCAGRGAHCWRLAPACHRGWQGAQVDVLAGSGLIWIHHRDLVRRWRGRGMELQGGLLRVAAISRCGLPPREEEEERRIPSLDARGHACGHPCRRMPPWLGEERWANGPEDGPTSPNQLFEKIYLMHLIN
jgi:hypothetical protein